MAEFEELRLTVNLVNSASVGLQKIRGEIGQLTRSASTMTAGMVQATAGLSSFATGAQNAQPKMRTLNAELRDMQRHAAETGRALGQMGTAAQQGFAGFPQIALALYDASGGVKGLGESMQKLGPVARVSTQALLGVGVGIAAVGAAVAAYGVSVFKMAKETDQLNRTAKTMGMSFGELKNAQDQAKSFGVESEAVIRSFQGVQAAQLDLSKANSQLREQLQRSGVNANWIDALGVMDPTEFTNAIVKYGNALKDQALASGAMPQVARAAANEFLKRFGVDINLLDMPPLQPMTESAKVEAAKLAKLSKDVMNLWNPLSVKLELIKLEALKAGLPFVTSVLEHSDEIIDNISRGIDAIGREITNISTLYQAITKPSDYDGWWADTLFGKKGESSLRDGLEWIAKKTGRSSESSTVDKQLSQHLPGSMLAPVTGLSPELITSDLSGLGKGLGLEDLKGVGGGGNSSLSVGTPYGLVDLSEKTETSTDQMAKLTDQLEKLNNFYARVEAGGGGGFGGGGASGSWGSGAPANANAGGGGPDGHDHSNPGGGASPPSSGVSKSDAEKIFSGGNVEGTVPATTTGGSSGYAGVGGYNFQSSGRAAAMGVGVAAGSAEASQTFQTGIPQGKGPKSITANKYAGPDLAGFLKELSDNGAPLGDFAGGYVNRDKRGGGGKSEHAFGNVIDIQRGFGSGPNNSPALYAWSQKNPELWKTLKSKYHLRNLAPEDGARMQDWGHLEWTPDRKAAVTAAAAVGGYPSSLFSGKGAGSGIGLDASIGSRSDIDRGALNDNSQIDAKGTVKVQVGGKTATEKAGVKHLFKEGSMETMEQMPRTSTGGSSVDDVAKQYMASR